MKTKILLIIALLIGTISIAQNEFNYKAIIKDGSGNLVVNEVIQVDFTILEDQISVYSETHSVTTGADGLVIINIGGGTPISGNFDEVTYYTTQHFLNVQIDTGDGLIDMGTTALKAVPYASYAEDAPTNAIVIFPDYLATFSQDFQIISGGRFRINIEFNICIDPDSISVGDNFTVIGNGGSATGTITFTNGGSKIIFTSNEAFTTIAPCFTGGLTLSIKGFGLNPVRDTNGRRIDGNKSGRRGGQFQTNFDIVC